MKEVKEREWEGGRERELQYTTYDNWQKRGRKKLLKRLHSLRVKHNSGTGNKGERVEREETVCCFTTQCQPTIEH